MKFRKSGFTLLEILLAILLLGTGLAILLQIISVGLFAGSQNEDEIVATYLCQEAIEGLRNTQFSSISQVSPAIAISDFPAFTREVLVTESPTGLKEISVNVYWFAGATQTHLSMVTYVSDI